MSNNHPDLTVPGKYKPLYDGFRRAGLELAAAGPAFMMGEESLEKTDCSGVRSYQLTRCGYPIRMTANGFMQSVFVFRADELDSWAWRQTPCALFFLAPQYKTAPGGRIIAPGDAVHVAPIVQQNIALNANAISGYLETVSTFDLISERLLLGQHAILKFLGIDQLKAQAWNQVDGLDWEIIKEYFE